jgi:glutathione S-transferase
MAEFIVHSVPGSPFGRAALIALEETGADYRFQMVAPGGMKSAQHLALHPFGRIPVLQHGDFTLYETQAIVRYVDRVAGGARLSPSDPKAVALMDQAMNISDWYLFQGVGNVIGFQRIVGPRLLGITPDEAAIEAVMPRAREVVAELARLLGDQPYFVGNQMTLADVALAPQVDFLAMTPEGATLMAEAPQLGQWLQRVNARPSLQATTWEKVAAMAAAA